MYSNETYEAIKDRVLNDINIEVDKREGSFINNMISPLSVELARTYIEFNHILGIMFAKNSYGKWLDMKANEWGVDRKLGVKATGTLKFTGDKGTFIPKGTSVKTKGNIIYKTINDSIISNTETLVDAEASNVGELYNIDANTVIGLEFEVYGINSVTNTTKFTGGINSESDEELKDRFFEKVRTPAISGNANQYKIWATSVDGVKFAKIEPLHAGPGTVKVVITNDENRPVHTNVVDMCKKYIEEVRPIGAKVTVITPSVLNINITCVVTLEDGLNIDTIMNVIREKVGNYIISCSDIIYISKISAIIGAENGVVDFNNLLVNNDTNNLVIQDDYVASLNNFELEKGGVIL